MLLVFVHVFGRVDLRLLIDGLSFPSRAEERQESRVFGWGMNMELARKYAKVALLF